ncbi:MAG: 50S ribosomal protein L35 [Planctomycetota bacterium]
MKTRKAVAKRVKVTARGKMLRRRRGGRHLKSGKSPKRIRRFRRPARLSATVSRKIKQTLAE